MNVPFLDLRRQYLSIKKEINLVIQKVIDDSAFILGNYVGEFEKNFANYCNAKHCIGVNSGTSALRLALMAAGIKQGDEIILPPNTFIATAEAISLVNAKPVFVDIDQESFNIDPKKIEVAITPKTKAIIPVDLYGQPADLDPIIEIAEKNNLKVIEDACQAHGAEYKNKKTGSISEITCFSFYPGKNLGAYGEGGAVVTNNEEFAEKIRMLRDHGQAKKHHHKIIGDNCRLEGIQGAVLNVKLKYLDVWIEKRRKNVEVYNRLLKDAEVLTPKEEGYAKHVYHLYVILTEKRSRLIQHLNDNGVLTSMHYPVPIHLQPAYSHLGLKEGSFKVTENFTKKIVSLPMFAELSEEEIVYVAEKIKESSANS